MRQDDPASDVFRRLAGDDRENPIICAFEMKDTDPGWDSFLSLAAEHGKDVVFSAEFTKAEIRAADWCMLQSDWHHGYPQPENGYEELVYDRSEECSACRVGRTQQAPFRMRGEPRWGRRSIMQMFWVYDAYFVKPETYRDVFEPVGVGSLEVLKKSGTPLESVVQLTIEEVVPLLEYRSEGELCETCGYFKLHSRLSDFAPKPLSVPPAALAFSEGWYGSGGMAYRAVLIRADLVQAMIGAGVRGASFAPCGDPRGI